MEEKADVLDEVKGAGSSGAFVHLLLVLGLVGIDALQDTQPPTKQKQPTGQPYLNGPTRAHAQHWRLTVTSSPTCTRDRHSPRRECNQDAIREVAVGLLSSYRVVRKGLDEQVRPFHHTQESRNEYPTSGWDSKS